MSYLQCAALLALAAAFASVADAQYTRADSTAAYSERTGSGNSIIDQESVESVDDSTFLVKLPFVFPFFDREYGTCYVGTNGRIGFNNSRVDSFGVGDLTAPVADTSRHNMIFPIGGDLYARPLAARDTVRVFFESGRVVFQWSDASFFNGTRLIFINFQCHLHSNGNIVFHYGPELNPLSLTQNENFASAIVSPDGSVSVAGFGNVTTVQTTRPADGSLVTYTYTAPTMADSAVLEHGVYYSAPQVYIGAATDARVMSFRLRGTGMGTTVDDITIAHGNFSGSGISLSLVEDTGTLGSFNGETAIQTQVGGNGSTVFTALGLTLTAGQVRNFLVLATFASLPASFNSGILNTFGALVTMPATVQGQIAQRDITIAPQPVVYERRSGITTGPGAFGSGATNAVVANYEWHTAQGQPNRTFTEVVVNYSVFAGTAVDADFASVRLYRDRGVMGSLDGNDILLGTVATPTFPVTFTGLNEVIDAKGRCYLIVVDFATTTNVATLGVSPVADQRISNGSVAVELVGGTSVVIIENSALPISVRGHTNAGVTDLIGNRFRLRSLAGVGTVSQLLFEESLAADTSSISAARVFLDGGSIVGQLDAGDTQVPGVITINAADIQFVPTTALSVTAAGTNYLLVVDPTASPTQPFRLDLFGISLTTTFTDVIGQSDGYNWSINGTATDGIDVTLNWNSADFTLTKTQRRVLGRVTMVARGAGGTAPDMNWSLIADACGAGVSNETFLFVYLEGAGPLGEVDSTDVLSYRAGGIPPFYSFNVLSPLTTGQTRNYLCVAVGSPDVERVAAEGRFTVGYQGLSGGTSVAVVSSNLVPGLTSFDLTRITVSAKKGGGGGGDDGCSTGDGAQRGWLLLFAALGGLVVASRLRRSRA